MRPAGVSARPCGLQTALASAARVSTRAVVTIRRVRVFMGSASSSLQREILVGRREQIAGDQPEPRLGDAGAVAIQDGDLVDGREHGPLVDELLDAMEDGLAPLAI